MKHYKCNINLIPRISTHHVSTIRFLGSYRSGKIVIAGKSLRRVKCLTYMLEDRIKPLNPDNPPPPTPHPPAPARLCLCVCSRVGVGVVGILKQPGKYPTMPLLMVSIAKCHVLRVLTKESSSNKGGVQYFNNWQEKCNLFEVCFYFSIIQLIMLIWLALLLYCSSIYTGVGTSMYWINDVLCCNICWCSSSGLLPKCRCSPCT